MEKEKIQILYLDDEVNNLISFKANYRKLYDIHTAVSTTEAKSILEKKDIHIIITDQRMPHMTGVQFLASIIKDHPYPIRMILSGYADIEAVIEAVNLGQIYRYLMKPYDTDELKKNIEDAYTHYSFIKQDKKLLDKYRKIFEESSEALFTINSEGYFTELNQAGFNLLKIPSNDLRNICIWKLCMNDDDLKTAQEHLAKNNFILDFPTKFKDLKNNSFDVLVSCNTIYNDANQVIGYQGIIRDITKQKETRNLIIRTIVETQDAERIRIAKDLHDSLGQQLSAIKFYLSTLEETSIDLKNNLLLSKSTNALTSALVDLRNICFNLMPNTIEDFGLIETIYQLSRQSQFKDLLEFNVDCAKDFPALNKLFEISIFRIIQEFITNAVKHGQATKITINFEHESGRVLIMLKDNGKGFGVAKKNPSDGMGLKNVYSRISSYNGDIKITSVPDKGIEYVISIPLSKVLLIN